MKNWFCSALLNEILEDIVITDDERVYKLAPAGQKE